LTSGFCATPGATSSACSNRTSPSCSPAPAMACLVVAANRAEQTHYEWPGTGRRAALVVGASFSHHAQGGGSGRTVLACPDPSRKRLGGLQHRDPERTRLTAVTA